MEDILVVVIDGETITTTPCDAGLDATACAIDGLKRRRRR
jgi:hypothetical protein